LSDSGGEIAGPGPFQRGCSGDEGVVSRRPCTRPLRGERSRRRRPAQTSAFVALQSRRSRRSHYRIRRARRPVLAGIEQAPAHPPAERECRPRRLRHASRGHRGDVARGHEKRWRRLGRRRVGASPGEPAPPFQAHMRFREFSEFCDQAGRVPSVGTRAVRRYVSIGCEPVPAHDVEPPSCVHCCSRPI